MQQDQVEQVIHEEGPPLRSAPFSVKAAAWLAIQALSLFGITWRINWIRKSIVHEWSAKGSIFVFWHGRSLIPAWAYRNHKISVLVSLHKDGEIMNRALAKLGFLRIRGSTTKGGRAALNAMTEKVRQGITVALTPDGPKGPRYKIHPGVVLLASRTGRPIVPFGIAARSFWQLKSWDGFIIPRPFSKINIAAGDPVFVPDDLNRDQLKEQIQHLKEKILSLEKEAWDSIGARKKP